MLATSLATALVSVLVAVTVADLERRVIPNAILAAGAIVGLHGIAARKLAVPFGPFLALGGVAALAVGDRMLVWYADGFRD